MLVCCSAPPSNQPTTNVRARPEPTTPVAPAHDDQPSEAECDALLAHAFGITVAAIQPPPSEADRVALHGELRAGFVADCRAGTRADHQCGLAAKSVADLTACQR